MHTNRRTFLQRGAFLTTVFSFAGINHFFSFWLSRQQLIFQVTEDTEIKINGEIYPLEGNSAVSMHGFIGKAIWPYSLTIKHKQGEGPPFDFSVFGIGKYIEIIPK